MEKIVEYKQVSKYYGDSVIIDHFNLTIGKGDFLCIVGSSGSGKTTIMKMINGLIMPDSGLVLVEGKQITHSELIELRRKIGYVIQGNALFPHMTVGENIGYVLRLEKVSAAEYDKRIKESLQLVGLSIDLIDRYPDDLSGGQQQRVGIARAYANHPNILLMDEPFGAVDSITRYQLQKDLKLIHRQTNCSVVFITHDIQEAFKLATHILVLDKGKIEQFGTVDEIKNRPKTPFVRDLIQMSQI
ncbi:ATP-binding cassette domain-containing protein [Streptococcus fryi]